MRDSKTHGEGKGVGLEMGQVGQEGQEEGARLQEEPCATSDERRSQETPTHALLWRETPGKPRAPQGPGPGRVTVSLGAPGKKARPGLDCGRPTVDTPTVGTAVTRKGRRLQHR